jgi:hypothetical protein
MRRQQYTYTIDRRGTQILITIRPARADGGPDRRYGGTTLVVTKTATGRCEARGFACFAHEEQEAAFREALEMLHLWGTMDSMTTIPQG